jgi:hypothetical protein
MNQKYAFIATATTLLGSALIFAMTTVVPTAEAVRQQYCYERHTSFFARLGAGPELTLINQESSFQCFDSKKQCQETREAFLEGSTILQSRTAGPCGKK